MIPPVVITSDGETPVVKYEIADAPQGALVATLFLLAFMKGLWHRIHDPQTETLNPGEILVATFTDPG